MTCQQPWGRRLWRDPAVRLIVTIVVVERTVLGLLGWLLAGQPRSGGGDPSQLECLVDLPGTLGGALVGPWQRDDGLWYQWIAEGGYGAHPAQAAFFPLYPATIRAVGGVIGGAYGVAALLVSTAALLAGLILLHRLVAADLGAAVAHRTVIYAACAPFAFFFLAPFSESLFLLLSVGAFLAARRRHLAVAGVLAALATACRLQGIVLMAPLLLEAVADRRERRRRGRGWMMPPPAHAAILLPAVSLVAVLVLLRGHSGPYGGFFAVEQHYWGVHLSPPWMVAADSVRAVVSGAHPEELANLLVGIALVALLPLMWRRLPRSYAVYAAGLAAPLWFHENGYSPMMSAGRFSSVVFPVFALLALLTPSLRSQRLAVVMLVTGMLPLFVNYTTYRFVG